jgi:hypothetical protein
MPDEASFERRGVKAGPQATAIAARSGLYTSERIHHWNWFEFEQTRRHSNHRQQVFRAVVLQLTGTELRVKSNEQFCRGSLPLLNSSGLELQR